MLCVDVNVLVYAHRADLREHADYRGLLERLANDDEPLGLPDSVLAGFIRVVTNRRVFTEPTSPQRMAGSRRPTRGTRSHATSAWRAPLDGLSAVSVRC